MERIRVFIADDHELVRMALRTLLEAEPDLEVVGEAASTDEAIDGTFRTAPDVLLLDMRMPGRGGLDVCRRVKAVTPSVAVLVVTSFDDDDELFGALESGANGYLMKDTRPDRIVTAIRALRDGQYVFDAGIASRIVAGRVSDVNDARRLLAEPLSERELEVLSLMARGYSNKDIARELWIGESTVKTHVSHVLRKVGAGDRTSAVLSALRSGLVRLEDEESSAEL